MYIECTAIHVKVQYCIMLPVRKHRTVSCSSLPSHCMRPLPPHLQAFMSTPADHDCNTAGLPHSRQGALRGAGAWPLATPRRPPIAQALPDTVDGGLQFPPTYPTPLRRLTPAAPHPHTAAWPQVLATARLSAPTRAVALLRDRRKMRSTASFSWTLPMSPAAWASFCRARACRRARVRRSSCRVPPPLAIIQQKPRKHGRTNSGLRASGCRWTRPGAPSSLSCSACTSKDV